MKTITLTLFVLLLLNSCALKREQNKKIAFTIMDKSITENTLITLQISNNTNVNYYLPIIKSFKDQKWFFIMSNEELSFFYIPFIISNDEKDLRWKTENCFDEQIMDKEVEQLDELWKQKKINITIDDLILLKSGKNIEIKIPINLHIKISKYCKRDLENFNDQEQLKIAINYNQKEKELANKFLSFKTLDTLKKMGYELYDKGIISNKVNLILDKQ